MTNVIPFPITPRPIKTSCDLCHKERNLIPYENAPLRDPVLPPFGEPQCEDPVDGAGVTVASPNLKWFCEQCFGDTVYFDVTMDRFKARFKDAGE